MELLAGVINHEYEPTSYRIEIDIDGSRVREIDIKSLAHDEKWEEMLSLTPQSAGRNQKVTFRLYKNNSTEPYLEDPLHLYLDVLSPPS